MRAQHQERAVDFLAKELKVYSPKDAEERVFFISAKETLLARLEEHRGNPAHSNSSFQLLKNYLQFSI